MHDEKYTGLDIDHIFISHKGNRIKGYVLSSSYKSMFLETEINIDKGFLPTGDVVNFFVQNIGNTYISLGKGCTSSQIEDCIQILLLKHFLRSFKDQNILKDINSIDLNTCFNFFSVYECKEFNFCFFNNEMYMLDI
jgi:hypothetical protein